MYQLALQVRAWACGASKSNKEIKIKNTLAIYALKYIVNHVRLELLPGGCHTKVVLNCSSESKQELGTGPESIRVGGVVSHAALCDGSGGIVAYPDNHGSQYFPAIFP